MNRKGTMTDLIALAVLTLAGCADQNGDPGPPAGTASSATVTATQSAPSAGLPFGSAGASPPAGTGSAETAAATSSPADCAAGHVAVSWNDQQAPTNAICVHLGAEIAINLYPPQQHHWTTPTSSDPTVATVATSAASQEGVMAATVEAQRTGTAAIAAVAKAMDGAPDPGSTQWHLVITVVA
jgi:hypothetical protein